MVIRQGDVYWVDFKTPSGSEPGYRHPFVVVQNNIVNSSNINTVIVCLITSNIQRAKAPGNVLLQKKEANLSKQSVVNVSQIFTVDKQQLKEKTGNLSMNRITEILAGIRLLTEPKDISP